MNQHIFVNLPVKDLPRAKEFYSALGYRINLQFTNEQAACIVISEHIHVMLLVEDYFKSFTERPIASAHDAAQVINCLSCESRQEVDEIVAKALAAGGKASREPQDLGFMYNHSFADLDGHLWEFVYMDPAAVMPAA